MKHILPDYINENGNAIYYDKEKPEMCTAPFRGQYIITLSAELFTDQSHTTFSHVEPLLSYKFDHFDILNFMANMRAQMPCQDDYCNVGVDKS